MPLFRYTAKQAFANRRNNSFSDWPHRGENNRIEPIARLKGDAKFTLAPGCAVFTVGSCFARNVERFLIAAGFRLPMRDLLMDPAFLGVPGEAVNNYSTPSIYNEFRWALDPSAADDTDVQFFETTNGFIDLHLGGQNKPKPLETVRARREAVRAAYRSVTACDAVIMTLGLSEVWFDTKTGLYLNHTPLPNIASLAPDRFELHVLSYDDVKRFIIDTLDLITRHSQKTPHVIMTVSPVPLTTTFRGTDVAVSNSYSKAVLRTVAEDIVSQYDMVSYFPAFESVGLSDRHIAWMPDQVHVTLDIIAVQVANMLQLYAPQVNLATIEDLEAAAVLEQAHSQMSDLEERLFYQRYSEQYATDVAFLVPYIRYLLRNGEALKASVLAEGLNMNNVENCILKARSLRLTERPSEALRLIEPLLSNEQRSGDVWEEVVLDYVALGDLPNAMRTAENWCRILRSDPSARPRAARAIVRLDPARARDLVDAALAKSPGHALAVKVASEIDAVVAATKKQWLELREDLKE